MSFDDTTQKSIADAREYQELSYRRKKLDKKPTTALGKFNLAEANRTIVPRPEEILDAPTPDIVKLYRTLRIASDNYWAALGDAALPPSEKVYRPVFGKVREG